MMSNNLEYQLDGSKISISKIQKELDSAYLEMKKKQGSLYDLATSEHINVDELPKSLDDILTFNKTGAGIDSSLVDLTVLLLGSEAAKYVGKDLWKKVLLPFLILKFGVDGLKQKKSIAHPPEED